MIGFTTFSDEQGGDGILYETLAEAQLARDRRERAGERCQIYEVGQDGLLYHMAGAAGKDRVLFVGRIRKQDFYPVRFVPLNPHLQVDSNGEQK